MTHRSPFIRLAFIVVALSIPLAAFAQPVGRGVGVGTTIEWPVNVSGHDRILVRVSTPYGDVISKEFGPGQPLTLRISDFGTDVPDGQYNYEFIVVPRINAGLAKKLDAARAANDDAAARKALRDAGIVPQSASGAFQIQNGSIISSGATESGSAAEDTSASLRDREAAPTQPSSPSARGGKVGVNDQVIPDDLIVQGSICAGFDCVNNESFGFDTIRMKENNTRVKFEDTSVGSFPTNDWQLTANDSASGGASKFSIEDITGGKVPLTVTAGAATNSIFVDSTGRVGFRTATPVLDLHVSTSNTPALRLEQTNAGGFTAQTWDVAGNEANFFVRDVTGGSRLSFRIRPGAPTSSIDISADGDVGIGTASPDAGLDVERTGGLKSTGALAIENPTDAAVYAGVFSGTPRIVFGGSTAHQIDNLNGTLRFFRPGALSMVIDSAGDVGINCADPDHDLTIGGTGAGCNSGTFSEIDAGEAQFTVSSSRELKENFNELRPDGVLDKIARIPVYTYDFKDGKKDRLGLVAEDFYPVFERGSDKMLSGHDVQMALWLAVQELTRQNRELNQKLNELEKAVNPQ